MKLTFVQYFCLHTEDKLFYNCLRTINFSVKTDLMEEGANSSLSVARVNKTDSGNYTCSISPTENATVTVHVLNGKFVSMRIVHGNGSSFVTCSNCHTLI